MSDRLTRFVALGATALLALSLAGCGGDSQKENDTLTVLHHMPYESADPQRIYFGVQIAHFRRLVYRGLVAFPMDDDAVRGTTPQPDLATDTGTSRRGGRVWEFTLKEGVRWEDGSPVTCEDVKYGTSRVFANEVITGGPNYTLSYLDLPRDEAGQPVYKGPYSGEGQAAFDRAVSCEDRTITFRFNKPWLDFPLAAAATMMVDPYKESFDDADGSRWKVLSNGPYRVEGGEWDKNKGATLVRNAEYDVSTDTPESLRLAAPEQVEMVVDPSPTAGELFNSRLVKDSERDQRSITIARLAPQQFSALTEGVEERYVRGLSPFTGYLSPNFERLTDVRVRRALALATDTEGWVQALGGERAAEPAENIVNPEIPGFTELEQFSGTNRGNPEEARELLEKAGRTPYPITVAYTGGPAIDKAMALLKEGWDAAGFRTTLAPLGAEYYDAISADDDKYDVTWSSWGADWPSMATVLPPLFDSRPNFSPGSCGQNFGCYRSEDFERLVDESAAAGTVEEQVEILQEANELLADDVAYIPMEVGRLNWLYGSKVTGFATSPASNGYPEIGLIGVEAD